MQVEGEQPGPVVAGAGVAGRAVALLSVGDGTAEVVGLIHQEVATSQPTQFQLEMQASNAGQALRPRRGEKLQLARWIYFRCYPGQVEICFTIDAWAFGTPKQVGCCGRIGRRYLPRWQRVQICKRCLPRTMEGRKSPRGSPGQVEPAHTAHSPTGGIEERAPRADQALSAGTTKSSSPFGRNHSNHIWP